MGQNHPDKILELFYEFPQQQFTVREIAKLAKIPKSTVQKYLHELKKEKLVDSDNRAETSLLFKTKKVNYFLEKLVESGLIEKITAELNPSCIILFGSIRKGDSIKKSDIDLFIECPFKKELNLTGYEKKLKHKIQLFIEKDIQNLPENLLNNVGNGIKIYGEFKLR